MFARTALIAIALTAAFAAANPMQAQVRHKLGFTIGANYASIQSDLFTTAEGRLSPVVGCNFQLDFNERFSLGQEIMFTRKGGTAQVAYFVPEQKADIRTYNYHYNTFEAGVFAGYQPLRGIPVAFQAGGFFGTHFENLNRNDRNLYVGDYSDINNAIRAVDLNDAFAGMDFGPAVGISAAAGRFQASARYYWGARNLYRNLDFVEQNHRISTNSLRISLTYFL
jgi:hypothetical protein